MRKQSTQRYNGAGQSGAEKLLWPISETYLGGRQLPEQDSTIRLIPLTQGKFATVDAADFERINQWKWFAHYNKKKDRWYAQRGEYSPLTGKTKLVGMHREVLNAPKGSIVDHSDNNSLNNQLLNLRYATYQQNKCNQELYKTNTSGYKGVHWHKKQKCWVARITVKGRTIDLGGYKHKEIAAQVYSEAAEEMHGEFARLF